VQDLFFEEDVTKPERQNQAQKITEISKATWGGKAGTWERENTTSCRLGPLGEGGEIK